MAAEPDENAQMSRSRPPWARLHPHSLQLGGRLGALVERTWRGNLLALDWDTDFLQPFAERSASGDYVGLGKSYEGLSRLAAHVGAPELTALRRHVLERLLAAQLPDGYLGRMAEAARVTALWDVHECAYLIGALLVDARLHRENRAQQAAVRLGDWLLGQLTAERLTALDTNICGHLAMLGLDRALLALTAATGDPRYRDLAVGPLGLGQWDLGIVEGRHGRLEGHAYAYLTRALARAELSYDEADQAPLNRALQFLRDGALVVTGTNTISECWHHDHTGCGELGETCFNAYLIRALDHLLRRGGDPWWRDTLERCVHNALYAAASPDGRQLRYYVPFDGEREWWPKDTYCCPGNFRRIVGELPELVYYRQPDGVVVNLYSASTAQVALADDLTVRLVQETAYPNGGEVRLRVEPSRRAEFALTLPVPAWCDEPWVAVNGREVPAQPGWVTLRRAWRRGDEVIVELPLLWRTERGREAQAGRVAVLRGPLVFGSRDGADVALDPLSFSPPIVDGATWAGGLACRAAGWHHQQAVEIYLTEHADPACRRTYFRTAPR